MRFSTVLSSALLLGASAALASDVIDLTMDDFESVVGKENLILVEFFAPWCGHCKALAPEYEKAATELAEKNIKIAKVDCVDQGELCGQHGVTGYPSLKVFRDGTPTDYGGPRKADGIVSYMIKQSLPAVSEVTAANHDEFKAADKVVLVAYLSTPTDAPASVYSSVAQAHRDDYMFGLSTDAAAATAAGVTPPAIVLYKKFDEGRVDFPATGIKDATDAVLTKFVVGNAMPLMDEVSGENYPVYAQSGLPLAYLFVDPESEGKQTAIDAVKPAAIEYKGDINFVWIDAVKFVDHAKSLGVPTESFPRFIITDMASGFKYPLPGTPNAASVTEFVKQFSAGKLEPSLKSADVPEKNDEPVTVVVGSEYSKIALDESKDVFIEFYAPWCGHCKRLAPIYEELGEHFSYAKDKLVIAKMDATENDLPPNSQFKISGFPTIKFRPAGSSVFIDYEGDRSLESMIEFINTNVNNNIGKPPVAAPTEATDAEPSSTKVSATETAEADASRDHDEL
ncbi:protein disulfide-isomerase precursor [Tulasnella sp. 330]|nr:protein disulfide-isomerase precursor [Tulasnella sp. 330]KAG8886514.1 protein disulfide-isomerase precursor [Tulasnella sp. 331]KAG8889772.1 protein disulfide-isomerase precursor [Tulasnella sp. 332]